MRRVMAQGDFRPMAKNPEAMADLVAILEARRADYARAEAELDTSGDTSSRAWRNSRGSSSVCGCGMPRRCVMARCPGSQTEVSSISAPMRLEYRMIGPRPDTAPTIVMLHEGLGCVGLWGDFPDRLAAATGAGVFVYSRAGYGRSSPVELPRPLTFMHEEAREVLPQLLDAIGFRAAFCSVTATALRSLQSTPARSRTIACAAWC